MAMKHASSVDNCNIFESYSPQRSISLVDNHVQAFSNWRTLTGSSNISPSTALNRTV